VIRPFDPRDVGLVARLQRDGMSLDLETCLTHPRSPLSAALVSSLPFSRAGVCTYIIDQKEESGYLLGLAQMCQRHGRPEYVVVFVSPSLGVGNGAHAIWQRLLTHLCVKAGEQGGQRLYAGLPADGEEEYQIFRHVGFAAYAQEDVYQFVSPPPQLAATEPLPLRRQRDRDSWGLQQLYATVTPRAVQNAEGSAQGQWELGGGAWGTYPLRRGYVWESHGEIWAALHVHSSRAGHWLRALLHPDALDQADMLVAAALGRVRCAPGQKLYCAVRTYEAGLPSALAAWGFRPVGSQTLVVKQTTVWAREPVVQRVPALESHAESMTPSTMPHQNSINPS